MKLLIDIPEHIYEHAKETTEDSRDEFDAMRAIANGTPARCMDEAEKERLIKKNMLSIENRVRNVFNQGYEMGVKESRSEIPNTCGDAISRQHLLEEIAMLKKSPWFNENTYGSKVIRKEAVEIVEDVCIKREPSVTPQQRTGRWIKQNYGWNWQCSECVFVTPPNAKEIFTFCPKCGAKMEVEDADSN
jgi:hypothetical protein